MINKVIVITGPTAIGKTAISEEVARLYDGEIINADASQFKRELNIGTAKIDLSETDIKYHLIDCIGPMDNFNVSDYQLEGRKLIKEIFSRNHTPIVVGGSGLYLNSLLYDYHFNSPKRNSKSDLNSLTNTEIMDRLMDLDEKTAKKIPINNRKRLIRALEVALSGNEISNNLDGSNQVVDAIIICLDTDRAILYERINQRVLKMLDDGLIDEVKALLSKGYDLKNSGDIGYKEVALFLDGVISYDEMIDEIQKRTRHLAKRQLTWFHNKLNPVYVEMDYNNPNIVVEKIRKIIEG